MLVLPTVQGEILQNTIGTFAAGHECFRHFWLALLIMYKIARGRQNHGVSQRILRITFAVSDNIARQKMPAGWGAEIMLPAS